MTHSRVLCMYSRKGVGFMKKKSVFLSLSALGCSVAIGATAFTSTSSVSRNAFANTNKTQTQYTLTNWNFVQHLNNFSEYGDTYDGFLFRTTSGRSDVDLVVLVHANSKNDIVGEQLIFDNQNSCVSLISDRTYGYTYNPTDLHKEYTYQENLGEEGGLAFIADQMICIVCKNYHYDENKYTYVYEELENFSDYSVSFNSWFSYSCGSTPGASEEVDTEHLFLNEAVRTFTKNSSTCDAPTTDYGYRSCCVGMKVDFSTISLSYSCEY